MYSSSSDKSSPACILSSNSFFLRSISSSSLTSLSSLSIFTPHSSALKFSISCSIAFSASSSQSRFAALVALSANAICRPCSLSRSISVRLTATNFVPSVSTIMTSLRSIAAAFSVVLLPAMMRLFLSRRMLRPAPFSRRLFSMRCCPNSVPLLKFLSSGIKSDSFAVVTA